MLTSAEIKQRTGNAEFLAPSRQAMLDRIRREIAAGTYLTEEKLSAAVDGLEGELRLYRAMTKRVG